MTNYVVSGYSAPAGINSKNAVKELQKQLNAKGAGLVVDGIYGAKTEAAYKSSLSSKTDPYYNSQAARVAQTYYAPISAPKTQSAAVSKTPKYALDIDSRAKAFVARTLERLGKSTTKKDEAEYQLPQTSKVLTLPYNKIAVDSKPTIKNMPATAQDTPNVVHTFPKTEQPRSSGLPAVWEIELGNALKKYVQQHPQDSSDKAVTANYGMRASNNKSPSQQKRDNQIKEEKAIADIRGATSYKISSSASSQDKLYDIIDRSFPLADRLRIRAKQTVEWLSEAEQDDLLINVMLDGPNAYFSREANEQRAYNTFFGREDVRLYPNATLPGEGAARQAYEQTKYVPNSEKPITYTNTSANAPIPEFGGKNSGSLMGGYMEELREYLSQLEIPDTPEKQTDTYGGSQYHWDYKNAPNDGGLGLEEARKEPLPTRDEWSDEHKAAYDQYRAEYPMPDYQDLWAEETRLLQEVAAGEKELKILMAQGNRNFPPHDIQGKIDKQREELNKSRQELREVQQLPDGKEYDPYLYKVQPLYEEYKEAIKMVGELETQLESDFSGSYSNAELNDKYKKWSGEVERLEKEIAAIPIVLTEETLSIPEAAKHADALSMRLPITKDDHRIIREAKDDVEAAIEYYRENGQTAEMLRAYDVWFALKAKQETSAAITGAANGVTYNVLKRLDAGHAIDNFEGANVASPQLQYMRSMYAIEMTNPGAYEAGEQVVNAISTVSSINGVLNQAPSLIVSGGKALAKHTIEAKIAAALNRKAEGNYQKQGKKHD